MDDKIQIMAESALRALLEWYNLKGGFCIYLVIDRGQGYGIVLRKEGELKRDRISFETNQQARIRTIILGMFSVRDKGAKQIDQMLRGQGTAMLVIRKGVIEQAYFHEGELWP